MSSNATTPSACDLASTARASRDRSRRRHGPRLSIIVPATNEPATLAAALAAIEQAAAKRDEVIVVREPALAGPAQARNVGAARASGDVLVFVDADVVVRRDALRRIRNAFAEAPDLTALFGSYDDAPTAPGLVSAFRNLLHHHVHHAGAGPATTFWSGLGAVRRDAFLQVGGFDAAQFKRPSVEDVDLGMRLHQRGGRIELDPTIQGTHLKRWTFGDMVRTDFLRRGIPWVRMLLGRRSSSTTLNLGWRHRLSAVASLTGPVAAAFGEIAVALFALLTLIAANRTFYALLLRRRGPGGAVASIPLHVIHHLTAIAALVAAILVTVAAAVSSLRRTKPLPPALAVAQPDTSR